MRVLLRNITLISLFFLSFQSLFSQIESINAEKEKLAAIVKECSSSKDITLAQKCTKEFLHQKLVQQLKEQDNWKSRDNYIIEYSLDSNGNSKVKNVIKVPRTVNKGDEEVLHDTFQKIINKQNWVPLNGYSNGLEVAVTSNLKINLAEILQENN